MPRFTLYFSSASALKLAKANLFLFEKSKTLSKYKVNPFPKKPWFLCVGSTSLLKTLWEKEKLLVTSNFSFSYNVFYLFGDLSAVFIKFEIVVCKLSQFGSVKSIVWERVKEISSRETSYLHSLP